MAAPLTSRGSNNQPGWLSFTALFSDDERHVLQPDQESPRVDSIADGSAVDHQWEASELSDIRLDISDIQEAIKNHDLWVQDAAAMRTDIDVLQTTLREHENWMSHLSSVVKNIQEKEQTLTFEMAEIQDRISVPSARLSVAGHKLMPFSASVAASEPANGEPGNGLRPSARGASEPGQCGDLHETEVHQLVAGLTQQLNHGLRDLHDKVTAVEGSIGRQLDGESAARRAAMADLRHEVLSIRGSSHSNTSAPELERAVSELRMELAALRTEQQLQAVAAGALALTQKPLIPLSQGRSRIPSPPVTSAPNTVASTPLTVHHGLDVIPGSNTADQGARVFPSKFDNPSRRHIAVDGDLRSISAAGLGIGQRLPGNIDPRGSTEDRLTAEDGEGRREMLLNVPAAARWPLQDAFLPDGNG